jgi:hypothetical protein
VASSFLPTVTSALPNIAGAVGAVRGLADTFSGKPSGLAFDDRYVKETTEELDRRALETLNQIRDVFSEIGGLTGISTPDAVKQYTERYQQYFVPTMEKYTKNVYGFEPDITKSYETAAGRIDDMTKQYSLLNRPGYMDMALNPATVKVDPSAITNIAKYYTSPEAAANYNYSGPQTQAMIRGRGEEAFNQIASAYSSPNVQSLMSYSY